MRNKTATAFVAGLLIGAGIVWGSGLFSNGRYFLESPTLMLDTRTGRVYGLTRDGDAEKGVWVYEFGPSAKPPLLDRVGL